MQFVAEATIRTKSGKGAGRQIRRAGQVPAVMYGQGQSHLIQLDPKAIQKILVTQAGGTGLIALSIDDGGQVQQRTVVIQDVQRDPVSGLMMHVDLLEVAMDKPVRVKVPVHVTGGVPLGVKRDKGVLHQPTRELHIECLPRAIPEHIEVDASALEVNQGIHVRDLNVDEGIRILDDLDGMVVNVTMPISEAKLSAMLTSEGTPAAAATATAEGVPAAEPSGTKK
ncbi:MAG: 50S ribosomal protein L25 [Nitrospira sp.]|nr:50S ribosomal protein L25 [Nitrospira sp.]